MKHSPEVERIARLMAFWHGQKVAYVKPGHGMVTVAAMRGYGSGFSYETERYSSNHWEEYSSAAERVLELLERQRLAGNIRLDWSKPCPAAEQSPSDSPKEIPTSPTPVPS